MTKFLVTALIVVSTFRPATGLAQSQPKTPPDNSDYKTYEIVGRLGAYTASTSE
jgi:hypothetical protein